MDISDDLIRHNAYEISRGVRPLVVIDSLSDPDSETLLRLYHRLESVRTGLGNCIEPIPFVVKRRKGPFVDYGFAARPWAI